MTALVVRLRTREWRWTPSTVIVAGFGLSLWLLVTNTSADADLWGHLRFGLDHLATGTLPVADHYSFTSDRSWINHEWLAELLMAVAYTAGGAAGLNALKLAAIGVVALVMLAITARERASPMTRLVIVLIVVFATYTRTQVIRPQLFSVALFCLVLWQLTAFEQGSRRALLGLPICFAVWVNLHGGWIVGLAAVGIWLPAFLVEKRDWKTAALLSAAGVAILTATLVNPYGVGLWRFLAETVRLERADITDWKPLLALPAPVLVFESILPAIAICAVAITKQPVPLRHLAVLAMLTAATFRVGRIDAFTQAGIAVFLAPHLVAAFERSGAVLRRPFWRMPLPAGGLITAVAVTTAAAGGWQLRDIDIDGEWVPDDQAALFLREHAAGSRLLTWFDWGEYAVWQLGPSRILVSMDGRRETVYSQEVIARHSAFYAGTGDVNYPDQIRADRVWLPRQSRMVPRLQAIGWQVEFESGRSLVLARKNGEPRHGVKEAGGRRIFPGP